MNRRVSGNDQAKRGDRGSRLIAFSCVLLLLLVSGACIQALPVAVPSILAAWRVSPQALAVPMALSALGTGLGTILGGIAGDAYGRRRPLIGYGMLMGLGTALAGLAGTPVQLSCLLFAAGIGLGGCYPLAITMMTELVPAGRRGLAVGLSMVSAPIGMTLFSLATVLILPRLGWPGLFLASGAAMVPLSIMLLLGLPESPAYLARDPARRSELLRVLARLGLPLSDVPDEGAAAPAKAPIRAVLLGNGAAPTALLWWMFFAIFLVCSAILGWMPVILSRAGFPLAFASSAMSSWIAGTMIGTPIAGWAIGRFGLLRIAALFVVALVLALIGFTSVELTPRMGTMLVVCLLVGGGVLTSGVITSCYTLAADIYPSEMRARGVGLADAVGRAGAVLGPFAGIYALDLAGPRGFFGLLACLAAAILPCPLLIGASRRRAYIGRPKSDS